MKPKPGITLFLMLLFCGCSTPNHIADRNLITDPGFENWFNLRGLGGDVDDGGIQGVFPSSETNLGKPSWTIAQWGSRYNFADSRITEKKQLSQNSFQLRNKSKSFTVNSKTGELKLGLFATACFEKPRLAPEPWPQLLIATRFTDVRAPSGFCKVENIRRLRLTLDSQLLGFTDNHPEPDPELHSARFLLQIIVQNLTKNDDGYGDALWFSVPVFDNRYEVIPESFSTEKRLGQDSAKFIFSMEHGALRPESATFFQEGAVVAGEDTEVIPTRVDLIPWMHYAFQLARKNGFMQTTSFRDLYISGMTLGWEISGSYDAVMKISDLALSAEY